MSSSKEYPKAIIVPVKEDMWRKIKCIAYKKEVSISEMLRSAMKKIIDSNQKYVDV